MLGRSSGLTVAQVRRAFRLLVFSLLPALVLFGTLEIVQRVRYSIRYDSVRWMYYGFWTEPDSPGDTIADAEQPDLPGDTIADAEQPDSPGDPIVGQRGINVQVEWQDDELIPEAINILCLGASSTYGVFNDRQETYPRLLSRRLNEAGLENGVAFNVFNRGAPGALVEDYQQILDLAFETLDPDVVIIYAGYNDFFIKDVNIAYSTLFVIGRAFLNQLWRYSLLAVTVSEKYLFWMAEQSRDTGFERDQYLEDEFSGGLQQLLERARSADVSVIVVPEVLMAKNFGGLTRNYESYETRYENVPTIVRELATRYDAEFLDFQTYFDQRNFRELFTDPVHLTDAGNRELSRLFLERSRTLQAHLFPAIGSQRDVND